VFRDLGAFYPYLGHILTLEEMTGKKCYFRLRRDLRKLCFVEGDRNSETLFIIESCRVEKQTKSECSNDHIS